MTDLIFPWGQTALRRMLIWEMQSAMRGRGLLLGDCDIHRRLDNSYYEARVTVLIKSEEYPDAERDSDGFLVDDFFAVAVRQFSGGSVWAVELSEILKTLDEQIAAEVAQRL